MDRVEPITDEDVSVILSGLNLLLQKNEDTEEYDNILRIYESLKDSEIYKGVGNYEEF